VSNKKKGQGRQNELFGESLVRDAQTRIKRGTEGFPTGVTQAVPINVEIRNVISIEPDSAEKQTTATIEQQKEQESISDTTTYYVDARVADVRKDISDLKAWVSDKLLTHTLTLLTIFGTIVALGVTLYFTVFEPNIVERVETKIIRHKEMEQTQKSVPEVGEKPSQEKSLPKNDDARKKK